MCALLNRLNLQFMRSGIVQNKMKFLIVPLAIAASVGINSNAFAKSKTTTNIAIEFGLKSANQSVSCKDTGLKFGLDNSSASIKDARFFVSNLNVIDAKGNAHPLQLVQNDWQYQNVALVDFEDASGKCDANAQTNTSIVAMPYSGKVSGISFDIGVPLSVIGKDGKRISLNHSNTETSPSPLNISGMGWNWQGGKKFIKFELVPDDGITRKDDKIKVWTVHLGSTGCAGNPADDTDLVCSSSNRVHIKLDKFNPKTDKVIFDIGALFAKSHVTKDDGGASGCMSSPLDPECAGIFEQLGLRLTESSQGAKDQGQMVKDGFAAIIRAEKK